jgi:serine/threonine-protein kinase
MHALPELAYDPEMRRDDESSTRSAPGTLMESATGNVRPGEAMGRAVLASSSPRISLPHYDVGEVLGRGGMGDVLLARDLQIGRSVAVKRLRPDNVRDESVTRFLREARVQARLEHPAILPVYEIGQDEAGNPYFSMKRLSGRTFAEQLASTPELPRQRLLRWFHEACTAVEFAHSKKVVHRDLKPSNIMVGDFNEVYVLDWGLARVEGERGETPGPIGDDVSSEDGMTQVGAMLGTPGYMAPEQMQDATRVTPAADVYSLGSILFELLTGEPLHPRGRAAILSTREGTVERPSVRAPSANVPPELDELCARCLEGDPKLRPTVKELAHRLEDYLDGDRDLERRRALAASYVEAARSALATGDVNRRAEAIQAAGRALVLDPTSADAGALVSRLTFEPAKSIPPELEQTLSAGELAIQQRQGKVAMGSFVVVLLYLGIAATNGVMNLPFVVGILAYLAGHAAIVWRITQRPASRALMIYVAFGNALLAALLSRTLGSMIIVPAVTCIMALSLTSYPQLIDRRWTIVALLVTSWVAPIVLEQLGVLQETWEVVGDNVVLSSHVMGIGGAHTFVLLMFSNVATFVVFVLFASALATSRRDAQQRSEIQAWHLRQLLPRMRSHEATEG